MAWKFFDEVVEGKEPNKIKRAVCKACGLSYVADGKYGTGNMRKHIKVCPKNNFCDVGQMLLGGSNGSGSLVCFLTSLILINYVS